MLPPSADPPQPHEIKLSILASLSHKIRGIRNVIWRGQQYPEITADDLPYGDGKTVVLDAEIRLETESGNITIITKTRLRTNRRNPKIARPQSG
jgi:hypothetical protein